MKLLKILFIILSYLASCILYAQFPSVEDLIIRGRAQYEVGNLTGARHTFASAQARDPDNVTVNNFVKLIVQDIENCNFPSQRHSKNKMLDEVSISWDRPQPFVPDSLSASIASPLCPIQQKLQAIHVPSVHFFEAPLTSVVPMLCELSIQFDPTPVSEDLLGVNFVLIDPDKINPSITLSLRNLSLAQILELVVKSVNFHYEIEENVVTIRPGRPNHSNLRTEFFSISRATVIRLTGYRNAKNFDQHGNTTTTPSQQEEEVALKQFFQRAGIPFDASHHGPEGAQFAFDGTQIIVTQTPRNLEKIHNILSRYHDTFQVEIESKFMEVQQGALEELGFRWNISSASNSDERFVRTAKGHDNNLRTLEKAFHPLRGSSGDGEIVNTLTTKSTKITNRAPIFPNTINIGMGTTPVAGVLSAIDGWRVKLIIDALEQHTGTDLMSAPKVTVLSGKTAKITVAQILRYPQSFGDIQSAVGTAGATAENSSAGVTITTGTPQNFTEKKIGVEMEVTPTVEDGGQTISLKLEPHVTEFEGFVEYGGRSIAISGGTTADVPSGFFQPIFSTREIQTEVTIANGATVIMGGLTREEIKDVHDKVPVLGDLPFLGRFFRSKGETCQKRNLLIFVTANLVGVGGAPINQHFASTTQETTYKNPSYVLPSGITKRSE